MSSNNKGFSLIELIIVIAIIAILSAALTPRFLKYINKAAIVSDQQTCKTLEKMVYTILSDDENHDLYALNGGMRGGKVSFMFVPNDSNPEDSETYLFTKSINLYGDKLYDTVCNGIPTLHIPKESDKRSYYVTVKVCETTITDEYTGTTKTIYTVGDINAKTTNLHTPSEIRNFFRTQGATSFGW